MRYHALAVDYDGTLATRGRVDAKTLAALERVRASGRRVILVSGRELEDLQTVFDRFDLFDRAVLENGALLYCPETREEQVLGEAPSDAFVEELRQRGVAPVSVGRSIVATWEPHETTVLEVIRDLGLEYQVIFNKGAVMVLPAGITKGTGLRAALDALGLSRHNTVGIGDAENDHAFLESCELAVAVANALPAVKERADFVTRRARSAGVVQVIEQLVEDDLAARSVNIARHRLAFGAREDGETVSLPAYGAGVLVAGPSGSGKSTVTTALLERLAAAGYQYCLIDPEGDYDTLESAIVLGTPTTPPSAEEALQVLVKPNESVVINLVGVRLDDRPGFFAGLLPRLHEMRVATGRPHWIVIDEAHHLVPRDWQPASESLPRALGELLLVTVHPDRIAPPILANVTTVIAVGDEPHTTLHAFARAASLSAPRVADRSLESGEVLLWHRESGRRARAPFKVCVTPPEMEHKRHQRKYAQGELIPEEHFVFCGPDERLNLRAQNLIVFSQLAEGVDDETWEYHLHRGDYANWFRHVIKDDSLADAAERIGRNRRLSPAGSRRRIMHEIESRYTAPA